MENFEFASSHVSSTMPAVNCSGQDQRSLSFYAHRPEQWVSMVDQEGRIAPVNLKVSADKGFIYSTMDDAFIVKKKNHFQVTVDVDISPAPVYIATMEGMEKVDYLYIHVCGCKSLNFDCMIPVMQSDSNRCKKQLKPYFVESGSNKVTIGRLHFARTTLNNTRRNGKPNPGQQYFLLVTSLLATSGEKTHTIASLASDRCIVRTSPIKSEGDSIGESFNEEMKRRDDEKRQLMMEISFLREQLAYGVKPEPIQTEMWTPYH